MLCVVQAKMEQLGEGSSLAHPTQFSHNNIHSWERQSIIGREGCAQSTDPVYCAKNV